MSGTPREEDALTRTLKLVLSLSEQQRELLSALDSVCTAVEKLSSAQRESYNWAVQVQRKVLELEKRVSQLEGELEEGPSGPVLLN